MSRLQSTNDININESNDFVVDIELSPETEIIDYESDPIDEYLVIVKDEKDWNEIHNYIINENEIDGIPNRRIDCSNIQQFSLRTSIYLMSREEVNILKNHTKIESVELNPEKYPQPQSLMSLRFKKKIAMNKPAMTAGRGLNISIFGTTKHTAGRRGNWSHIFVNEPNLKNYQGVGIQTSASIDYDLSYSMTGKGVDAVIIDSGVAHLHPEFLGDDGKYRVKDVILDGPYKVDPEYFDSNNLTYTKVVDGIEIGVGIATTAAHEWWGDSTKRSSKFSKVGTFSIHPNYDLPHVSTKTTNSGNDQLIDGHGTACASQIGGKSFGLAFECNLWNIRILLGGVGGIISGDGALNICAIWHGAKIISQNGDPDPTLINNSWGAASSTGYTSNYNYTHGYRGTTLSYTGTGSPLIVPENSGACRNHKYFTYNYNGGQYIGGYGGSGGYPYNGASSSNSAAENAISAGCIVVAAAGNDNQKMSDINDVDYNNWYSNSNNYTNRVFGVQKGGANITTRLQGTIVVGALDCAVEPFNSKQGATSYSVRRVCYSNNGPMINVWAPAEMTMAAGYSSSYEDYTREDDSSFYDCFFNGTSSACPNTCSVIALYLQYNRKAKQSDVHWWLDKRGTVEIDLSDPYSDENDPNYWSRSYDSSTDSSTSIGDCYNLRGNSNLRGAPKKVLYNPFNKFNQDVKPSFFGVDTSGFLFTQS